LSPCSVATHRGKRCLASIAIGAACVLLLLVACKAETSGSPTPPPEFGAVSRPLLGCPTVQGVYAWPPAAGMYADRIPTNREPREGGIPVPARRGAMQIWVTQSDSVMTFRSRSARQLEGLRDRLTREWSYAEYNRGAYSCSSGMLEVRPVDIETKEDFGGKGIRRGFKLAVLKDGSLAVGIKTISYGHTTALFAWGDVSRGSIRVPDKTFWRWSKLARLESGDKEPAPANASRGQL